LVKVAIYPEVDKPFDPDPEPPETVGGAELPGRNPSNRVAQTETEQIDAKLFAFAAVHAGKAHFQQNLRIRCRHIYGEQVDDFANGGSDLDGSGRTGQILDRPA
jgi:hypothetical protein